MNTNQTKQKRYRIVDIHRNFKRNKDNGLKYFVYAKLVDENNNLWMAASLDDILYAIESRDYILVDDVL